jgi:hypothetical protein
MSSGAVSGVPAEIGFCFDRVLPPALVVDVALTESRQHDPAARAVHEPATELVFELSEALTHPGGCELKPLGGPTEVELLGKRDKDPQLAQFDAVLYTATTVQPSCNGRNVPSQIL